MRYANGCVYDGEWRNDLRDGTGVFQDATGNHYKGGFLKGRKHGKGEMYFRGVGTITLRFNNGLVEETSNFTFEKASPWADPEF